MPRGYRGFIFAVVGWLALCGAQPPAEQPNSSTPTGNKPPTPAPTPTGTFIAYPDYDPDPCYHSKDHDAADLCAQWRASIAAEKAAHEARRATSWTIVATILSAAGLAMLFFSMRQTRKALRLARRANKIARDTGKRQLRAYITAENISVVGLYPQCECKFLVELVNHGQTPAHDVEMWSIPSGTSGEPDAVKIFRKGGPFRQSRMVLGPDQKHTHVNDSQGRIAMESYVAVTHGFTMIFAGVIKYRDVFGKRHFTTFKYFLNEAENIGPQVYHLVACGRGNNAS